MSNRRIFLRGVTALPLIGGAGAALAAIAPSPASAGIDPFPGHHRELVALLATIDEGEASEDEKDLLMDRWNEIDRLAMATKPTTLAGVVACLEYARREYVQFEADGDPNDFGERLMLALLDNAIGGLRGVASDGRAS